MRRILALVSICLLAIVVALSAAPTRQPVIGQEGLDQHVSLPLVLDSHRGSFPTSGPPRDTPWPSRTPRPTAVTPTAGPSPTPTLAGEWLEHPTGETIVFQVGWTWTEQIGSVWQQMEGTPWMTVYGNGRVIAGHELFDRRQQLFEGQVTAHQVQVWLRYLAYDIGFFGLAAEYDHPESTKPSVHAYVLLNDGYKRVTVRGWDRWVDEYPPNIPDAYQVKKLCDWLVELQETNRAEFTVPYEPEWYTILAQEVRPGPMLPDPPEWTSTAITITAIADAAPLAKPSPIDRLVGHMPVDRTLGKTVWDLVVPVADAYFPFYKRAAEFMSQSRPIAVGVRQEVPGGSDFLPEWIAEGWYRVDINQ